MVTCPHCEQPVDETARDTCPLCFTPLAAALEPKQAPESAPAPAYSQTSPGVTPLVRGSLDANSASSFQTQSQSVPNAPGVSAGGVPPGGMSSGLGPGVMRSLTGEIIETPTNSIPMAAGYAPRPAGNPGGYSSPRPSTSASTQSSPKSAIAFVVVLLILGAGCFGFRFWWLHRTNPKEQAEKFCTALKSSDWKSLYDLVERSPEEAKKYKDAQDFADQAKSQLDRSGFSSMLTSILSSATFEPQDPKDNDGSTATVPVKIGISLMGKTISQNIDLKMINDGGIWKVSKDNNAMKKFNGVGSAL